MSAEHGILNSLGVYNFTIVDNVPGVHQSRGILYAEYRDTRLLWSCEKCQQLKCVHTCIGFALLFLNSLCVFVYVCLYV